MVSSGDRSSRFCKNPLYLSGRWKLYLGGWMEAEFDPNKTRVHSAEWKTREATQGYSGLT
jgi:hypothetical protein